MSRHEGADPGDPADLAERLYVAVQHAGKRLRILDDELGLSPVRFSVMGALAFHPPMTVGELARFEHVRSPSMTRLLRDMERDGLVRREPDPHDGRRTLVVLTPRGREVVDRARGRKIALFAEALRGRPAEVAGSAEDVIGLLDALSGE
jgi:DNA-binding MarR family transcriptional regulator